MLPILLQPMCFELVGLFSRVLCLDNRPGLKACGRFATGNPHEVYPRNGANTKTRKMNHLVRSMSGEIRDSDKENA
jgi:hypothetical protein